MPEPADGREQRPSKMERCVWVLLFGGFVALVIGLAGMDYLLPHDKWMLPGLIPALIVVTLFLYAGLLLVPSALALAVVLAIKHWWTSRKGQAVTVAKSAEEGARENLAPTAVASEADRGLLAFCRRIDKAIGHVALALLIIFVLLVVAWYVI